MYIRRITTRIAIRKWITQRLYKKVMRNRFKYNENYERIRQSNELAINHPINKWICIEIRIIESFDLRIIGLVIELIKLATLREKLS